MKKPLLIILALLFTGYTNAQNVTIPDANFKAYLVGNSSINTNSDTEIQISEASLFTGGIYCQNLTISDLTGIEAFTSLTALYCHNNQLTSLNLSNNTNLIELYCYSNPLSTLNVSNLTNLVSLYCYDNSLTSLNVLNCISLQEFYAYNNNLTSLNLSTNTSLWTLFINDNQLTSLNVKNGNNQNIPISFVDMRNNPNLSCILVDDSTYSATNWTNIDATSSFSETCGIFSNISENQNNYEFTIYPVVSSTYFTLNTNQKTILTIFSIEGKFIESHYIDGTKEIDVQYFTNGIYILKMSDCIGNNYFSSKFIKE